MIRYLNIIVFLFPLVTGFRIDNIGNSGKEFPIGYIDITVESNTSQLFFKYELGESCLPFEADKLNPGERENNSSFSISIPVKDFKCANALVHRDFLSLLKADEYPYMQITIPRESILRLQSDKSSVLHKVLVTIAGVSRNYDMHCIVNRNDDNNCMLIGTAQIMLSDLAIEPPVKFMGLVKIKDEIIVNFGFCLKENLKPQLLISDN